MRLLLHVCCGPCAYVYLTNYRHYGFLGDRTDHHLSTQSCINSSRHDFFWFNPNIQPLEEYQNRRDSLISLTAKQGINLFINDTHGGPKAGFCAECYQIRLEHTAAKAANAGYDAFSTTLLVSPFQNFETLVSIGRDLSAKYNVKFIKHDFRQNFRKGKNEARALGLYIQKYCGCQS
jgi:hypothetical protein